MEPHCAGSEPVPAQELALRLPILSGNGNHSFQSLASISGAILLVLAGGMT